MAQTVFSARRDEPLGGPLALGPEATREKAMQAFLAIRAKAAADFPQGMGMDEIDEEIRRARHGDEAGE